ncbi:MAG: outer membrane protein assembly factor BamE [Methylotenera sp.]|nr:outer membrane protein assembly factor BamE [Methylotenera sp.]
MRNLYSSLRCPIILLAILCTSCGTALPTIKPFKIDVQQGNVVTSKMLLQLRPGMTKSQVRFVMGTPLIQDSFHGNRWDYAYQMREDGKITEQRRVILDFENDLLKSVRGDVTPQKNELAAESANTGVRAVEPGTSPQKKSMLEKLKFWKSDKAEAVATAPAIAATATAAEETAEKTPEPVLAMPLAVAPEQVAALETEAPKSVLAQEIELPATIATPEITTPNPPSQEAVQKDVQEPVQENTQEIMREKNIAAEGNATASVASPALSHEAVIQTVTEWAEAWRTKNANQYLGFYADKFRPDGNVSKKNWAAQRKQRLSGKQGDITLALEDLQAQVQGSQASVQFFQKYSSKVFSDQVSKRLDLEFDQTLNRWLIVKESIVENAKRPEVQKVLAPENTSEHLDGVIEKIGF